MKRRSCPARPSDPGWAAKLRSRRLTRTDSFAAQGFSEWPTAWALSGQSISHQIVGTAALVGAWRHDVSAEIPLAGLLATRDLEVAIF
jgi:hypothetical protein